MSNTTPEGKTDGKAKCQDCNHQYTLLYLPLGLHEVGEIMQSARCPMCAGKNLRLVVDKNGDWGGGEAQNSHEQLKEVD